MATAFVTAGGGFLLAVLWFDLMFDVQVLAHRRGGDLPAQVLDSISAYYARVTTAARPMNRLVAAVMVATLVAIVVQIADDTARWVGWTSLVLVVAPIAVAAAHTFPSAVRLGARGEDVRTQSRLARSICRDHVLCFVSVAAALTVQLTFVG